MKKIILFLTVLNCLTYTNLNGTTDTKYSDAYNVTRFLLANYYQYGSDLKKAEQWYNQITPDNNQHYIYLGYIPLLAANNAFDQIVQLIPELDNSFKDNQEIQILFAAALEKVGKKSEAQERLVALNDKYKTNQELAFKVAQLYLERSEPENCIKVIDNLLNSTTRRPNNYIFHFLKSQVYLQLNKKQLALESIKQSIETYPKFDKSWLLYAILHEQEGKLEEAVKGYKTYLEVSPEANAEVQRHLLSLTFRQKIASQKNDSFTPATYLENAIAAFEKKDYKRALNTIDDCLAQNPNDVSAKIYKIQILATQNKFDQITNLLSEWITKDEQTHIWMKITHLLCYMGLSYKKALTIFGKAEKQKGTNEQLLLYQADLALRDNNLAYALNRLEKAYTVSSDKEIKTKIAFQMGIIHYDKQNWTAAQKILEDAQTLGIEYPPLQNLLAYLYATKNKDFKKADQLITKALQKDPTNGHFLDTQALVFYKQGNYTQAIALLEKATQTCHNDYTILHHLGKCHFKNGDTHRALESIEAARMVAKTHQQKTKAKSLITAWTKS